MVILLSPAKKLNENYKQPATGQDNPAFFEKAREVNKALKKLSPKQLAQLQSISADLAELNYARNQSWQTPENSSEFSPAIFLFNGDAYSGLDVQSFSNQDLAYANNHLRILSGLYGILKPSDLIEPYRLEMGSRLPIGRKKNLYDFWQKDLTNYIHTHFDSQTILNLASTEYAQAIDFKKLDNRVVEPVFKDRNAKGAYKVMSYFAKRARGLMAKYVIQNQIKSPEELINFTTEGYSYDALTSTRDKLVFLRHSK
jgi:cytoplasmic iron level regulating protein YaaA (DUF328/UPF0246 family)